MINIIIFGPPGSGKGTQSQNLVEKYKLDHISTGDIFRREIKNQTKLGLEVKNIIDEGKLVPDELVIKILGKAIEECSECNGVVFDGFPRTQNQASELDKMLALKDQSINVVISLEVDDDELIKRLLKRNLESERTDDSEDIVISRLKIYHEQTKPLVEFYKEKGLYRPIRGIGSIEEIFDRICQEIDKLV